MKKLLSHITNWAVRRVHVHLRHGSVVHGRSVHGPRPPHGAADRSAHGPVPHARHGAGHRRVHAVHGTVHGRRDSVHRSVRVLHHVRAHGIAHGAVHARPWAAHHHGVVHYVIRGRLVLVGVGTVHPLGTHIT